MASAMSGRPTMPRIAYDWQGQVYVADGDGGNVRTIGPGSAPAWSPDGKRLAFERATDKGSVIMIADLDEARDGARRRQPAGLGAGGGGKQPANRLRLQRFSGVSCRLSH